MPHKPNSRKTGIVHRVSMISLEGFIFLGVYEKTKKNIENYWF